MVMDWKLPIPVAFRLEIERKKLTMFRKNCELHAVNSKHIDSLAKSDVGFKCSHTFGILRRTVYRKDPDEFQIQKLIVHAPQCLNSLDKFKFK